MKSRSVIRLFLCLGFLPFVCRAEVILPMPADSLHQGRDSLRSAPLAKEIRPVYALRSKLTRFAHYSALSTPLNTFDLQTSPAALGDILGGLQMLPTVQTCQTDGRPMVLGGSANETQTYIDGLLVLHPHSLGMNQVSVRNRFNMEAFEDISLQAGGYSATLGHALSGVLSLKTHSLSRLSRKTVLGLSSTGAYLTQTFGGAQSGLYIRATYTDMEPYGRIFGDSYEWRRRYHQQGLDFIYAKQRERWQLRLQGLASVSGANYLYNTIDGQNRHQVLGEQYAYAQANADLRLSPLWQLSVATNMSLWAFRGTEVLQSNDRVQTSDIGSHSRVALKRVDGHTVWQIGADHLLRRYRQDYALGQTHRIGYTSHTPSAYIDAQYIRGGMSGNLGLRMEYNNLSRKVSLSCLGFIGAGRTVFIISPSPLGLISKQPPRII